jgi:PST family polysaccharide transporter
LISPEESSQESLNNSVSDKRTYGEILKSSALVGGSAIFTVGIGVIRTKLLAVMLGPGGLGLLSLYGSVVNVTQTLAGMGVSSSGVRQIAEAVGSNQSGRAASVARLVRRVTFWLALLGGMALLVFARPIARFTFGNGSHSEAIAALSVAVFFGLITAGQGALLQGTRRMGDLARMSVVGACAGTVAAVPSVYLFGQRGVVASLLATAGATAAASWWYGRRVRMQGNNVIASASLQEVTALLKLGFAFMVSTLMTMGTAFVIRITLSRKLGIEATGLYQSAWNLGGLYVGLILQAMAADFYPRLAANADYNPTCNRLVNEQTQVGLLLAGPGVLGTLTFAPLVIALCYSAKFAPAIAILRWICLGTLIQVITWPMGYIIIAKAKQTIFFVCEIAWAVGNLLVTWLCISRFGLVGVGIGFFVSYVLHAVLIYDVVHRMTRFEYSSENRRTGLHYLAVTAIVFCGFYFLPFVAAEALGVAATLWSTVSSIRSLTTLVSPDRVPASLQRVLGWIGRPVERSAEG